VVARIDAEVPPDITAPVDAPLVANAVRAVAAELTGGSP
jgi:hypothetical protein